MKRKIQNLSDLRHEQELLRIQLQAKQSQLGESWTYLKHNYKGMIWNEINPFKGSSVLSAAIGLLQPGLLPVVTEVAKGTVKGSPINMKVLGSAAKYAIASMGIKWLRKWIESKEQEDLSETPLTDEELGEEPLDPMSQP